MDRLLRDSIMLLLPYLSQISRLTALMAGLFSLLCSPLCVFLRTEALSPEDWISCEASSANEILRSGLSRSNTS